MIINKDNIIKDVDILNKKIKEDNEIDLEKIKKYFENVINEKHFLVNYAKAKNKGEDGRFFDETSI